MHSPRSAAFQVLRDKSGQDSWLAIQNLFDGTDKWGTIGSAGCAAPGDVSVGTDEYGTGVADVVLGEEGSGGVGEAGTADAIARDWHLQLFAAPVAACRQ